MEGLVLEVLELAQASTEHLTDGQSTISGLPNSIGGNGGQEICFQHTSTAIVFDLIEKVNQPITHYTNVHPLVTSTS